MAAFGNLFAGVFPAGLGGYGALQQQYAAYTASSTTYNIVADFSPAAVAAPVDDSALAWLDRRVNEMRVAL